MAGRMFAAVFNDVAIAAAQDCFYLKASANVPFYLHQVILTQKTLTSWEGKNVRIRRIPATVTVGSGGTSVTPNGLDPGGLAAAAVTTVRANDTTAATSSGTAVDEHSEEWNFLNGLLWVPAFPEGKIYCKVSEALVVHLDTAPSSSMTASGTVVFEELG